jgi:hypothetical protein
MNMPPKMQKVAGFSDLADGGMKRIDANGTPVLLIRSDDAVHAYGADCPHAGAPLEQGGDMQGAARVPVAQSHLRYCERCDRRTDRAVADDALYGAYRARRRTREQHSGVVEETSAPPADTRTFAIVGAGAAVAAACCARGCMNR